MRAIFFMAWFSVSQYKASIFIHLGVGSFEPSFHTSCFYTSRQHSKIYLVAKTWRSKKSARFLQRLVEKKCWDCLLNVMTSAPNTIVLGMPPFWQEPRRPGYWLAFFSFIASVPYWWENSSNSWPIFVGMAGCQQLPWGWQYCYADS